MLNRDGKFNQRIGLPASQGAGVGGTTGHHRLGLDLTVTVAVAVAVSVI